MAQNPFFKPHTLDAIREIESVQRRKGYLTYADINEALPESVDDPEEIEAVIIHLQDQDFAIVDPAEEEHFLLSRDKKHAEDDARLICPDIGAELFRYFCANPEKMRAMPSRKFEEMVASVFENHGYTVELTPQTRDGGFDILAIQKDELSGSTVHLIECKRYSESNKVGVGLVRTLLGVVSARNAHKGHLVTTSTFTSDADVFAEQNSTRLVLSDYRRVVSWLRTLSIPHDFRGAP